MLKIIGGFIGSFFGGLWKILGIGFLLLKAKQAGQQEQRAADDSATLDAMNKAKETEDAIRAPTPAQQSWVDRLRNDSTRPG